MFARVMLEAAVWAEKRRFGCQTTDKEEASGLDRGAPSADNSLARGKTSERKLVVGSGVDSTTGPGAIGMCHTQNSIRQAAPATGWSLGLGEGAATAVVADSIPVGSLLNPALASRESRQLLTRFRLRPNRQQINTAATRVGPDGLGDWMASNGSS